MLMKNVLDTDGNGFIDFNTFKEKFGPNMSRLIKVPEREVHLPNLVPNIDKTLEYADRSKSIRTSFDVVKKAFQPELDAKLIPATRFGAKPPHPNTFVNHHAGPNTPGFISENVRFGGTSTRDNLNTKIGFQAEDKAKKDRLQETRVMDKQKNLERLGNQITM